MRDGICLGLAEHADVTVVGTTGCSNPDLRQLSAWLPAVVLVDIDRGNPTRIAQRLAQACPEAKLVMFAIAEEDEEVLACAAAGYAGYVPRDGGTVELYRAVMDAAQGRLCCAPHIAAAMFNRLGSLLRPERHLALPELTPRESSVLHLVEQGCSNKDIARQLRISAATVKNHMHSILQKLRCSRRGEAGARLRLGR
ncbi:response regulator transcription factor [Roseomonas marmotae]|uniref:Response regulator transcription factor n=1 Tax=Roseomonas marmotae TaxID=2768161 RepID=A0ABS3KFH1_9PROT|nr:response regulator transcription factor [Roseomonas marmotae]MBO1076189.1 response regulator transcription factor [Roseomonas marmotae]QTI81775.1 response regulator transcription factor [Roseomonas marmotae]